MIRWFFPLLLALWAMPAQAQSGTNQAVLVVAYGAGQSEAHCISFSEESLSGYELLQRAGLELAVETSGMGTAVCRINDKGCPANDCFCQCRGADCEYWSFWQWQDGAWQYARVGAHVQTARNGAMQGWTWGPGSVTEAPPPPIINFDDVCTNGAGVSQETAVSEPAVPWLSYVGFALILLILGGLLLRQRRRS